MFRSESSRAVKDKCHACPTKVRVTLLLVSWTGQCLHRKCDRDLRHSSLFFLVSSSQLLPNSNPHLKTFKTAWRPFTSEICLVWGIMGLDRPWPQHFSSVIEVHSMWGHCLQYNNVSSPFSVTCSDNVFFHATCPSVYTLNNLISAEQK